MQIHNDKKFFFSKDDPYLSQLSTDEVKITINNFLLEDVDTTTFPYSQLKEYY